MKRLFTTKQIVVFLLCIFSYSHASIVFALDNRLIDYVYIGEFSKETAKLTLQKIPPLDKLEAKHSLTLYKIRYKTPAPNGNMTIASGFVAMPSSPVNKVGIVSFQHGTRVTRSDVPSRNDEKNYIYPAVFGSSGGYMLVMPDYLGLGDNDLPIHPYVHAETLASSSIDMLIASKELAKMLNYPINDTLFLAGYSEGGFSTMVMYESLLQNYKEIPITAVAPGSAPYDWYQTIWFMALHPGPRATIYMAYFFYATQTFRNYWSGLDEIFKKPYNTLIPKLFDGYHQPSEILQSLPAQPKDIFNYPFYANVVNGTDIHSKKLEKNFNHYDFKSTSPLLLVGTQGDKDLPYHGAEIAYKALKRKSDQVHIKNVSDVLDHIEAFPYVMKEQLEFFKAYESPQ